MIAALAFAALGFAVMEPVSYLAHRYVMHGPAMAWHASHHASPTPGFERNDLFPLCFSVIGVLVFAVSAAIASSAVFWIGVGMAAYGAAYLYVHEVAIHRRFRIPVPDVAYVRKLREAHRAHHLTGGEYFGMLVPVAGRTSSSRSRARPQRDQPGDTDILDRRTPSRASTRQIRSRL